MRACSASASLRAIVIAAAMAAITGSAAAEERVESQGVTTSPVFRIAAAEPGSLESLFDAPEQEKSTRSPWSGFYDFELAYTYAKPAHWSRAVNRLQLVGQGALGDGVNYKLGVRIDADPVYASSDFYLPAVRRDQRLDAIWRENYVDFSAADWDFRVGAQQIVWGEVVGLFVADVVSARDQREFFLPSFDIVRIPQWALRAEKYMGDAHLELVWIPIQTFDDIGEPGSDFYPVVLPSPLSQAQAEFIRGIERPRHSLDNSSFGVRANGVVRGWDLAGFYYRSFSTTPSFYPIVDPAGALVGLQPKHDRLSQFGATLTKDVESFVVRAEAVYVRGQNFLAIGAEQAPRMVERSTLDYIVSAEVPFGNEGRFNVQAFQRVYFGGSSDLALQSGDFGVSALVSAKMGPRLEPQFQWMQTFGGGGGLIRPRLNWRAEKNLVVGVGADIFTGPADGFFGRYNNRDRLYSELRYDF